METGTSSPKTQDKTKKLRSTGTRSKVASILASPPIDLNGVFSLSLREVAQVHNVCERTAWSWYDQGILKGRKIGQVLRFDIEHVRALFRPSSDESKPP